MRPEPLQDAEVFSLDTGALLAGTRFRGDFEERFKAVIKALSARPKPILFIDEIHSTVGAGATTGGTMDLATLIKPILTAGDLRVIGSTTFEEFKHIEKDRALARRLQKIAIDEPSIEETVRILAGLRSRYEEHHRVDLHRRRARSRRQARRAASARLPAARQRDRCHRRSRRRALGWRRVRERRSAVRHRRPAGSPPRSPSIVDAPDIERVVARMARIPARQASSSDRERLRTLEESLERVVFGQKEAVHLVAQAIKRSRAGLGQPDRPAGCFLFTGPTGVGKTELAKQLAIQLGNEFIRFDMSEYMEKHAVARLIGAPPGYVGFEQGGQLVDAVRTHPYSVVLLDEIEKAHPDIYNILLQVMDHATLTDNTGRKADFRNVVLILTSNAGSREMSAKSIGFADGGAGDAHDERLRRAAAGKSKAAIERVFSPEFRNRLDAIVTFQLADAGGDGDDRREVRPAARSAARRAARRDHAHAGGARLAGEEGLRPGLRRAAARARRAEGSARSADRRDPLRQARARRHGDDRRRRRRADVRVRNEGTARTFRTRRLLPAHEQEVRHPPHRQEPRRRLQLLLGRHRLLKGAQGEPCLDRAGHVVLERTVAPEGGGAVRGRNAIVPGDTLEVAIER